MQEFSVTLFSNDSLAIYPENQLASFTNKLYRPIELEGNWSVGVTEMYLNRHFGPKIINHGFISTEIIKPRHVGSQYTRCLKVFHITEEISNNVNSVMIACPKTLFSFRPEFYPLENNFIDEISILITDEDGETLNFWANDLPTYVTLQFRKE